MIKKIKNIFLDKLSEFDSIISIVIIVIVFMMFSDVIVKFYNEAKQSILDMIISVSGTLFGFILTFLSVLIMFKTDPKYKKNKENENEPLIMLINNNSFKKVYELFIKSSYTLGLLLLVCIIYYFTTYGLDYIINFIFVFIIMYLIVLNIIRMGISVYSFNLLIRILINSK